ncbi:CCA tRNA nucleotidyltransferase [Litoreibacter arenae]|uniref:tRNA nucleotidyltransferase n=1 Tax=Litoreibacter arenae DSM 19593 TaxID=1123360 RepID=S9Q7X0_9RHOB|nr:CCA tRNA nucleotidyltransferase [Litoreibacter arenae]EPX77471.1 tRNA nucleotidyltransferase [Litoreibacter arenae DSM 19593]
MTVVTGDWLTNPATQAVFDALVAAGIDGFFVGGCVRNALLGAPVADIDMTTSATPGQVSTAAEAVGLKVVPTGIDHGTVTVVSGGIPHEVTTFRRDMETDGRRAQVAFSASMAEDAARRDFTMNALYADRRGAVTDPVGGLPDLNARRVRFIGDADARIAEDYLRILRFFRFHAWYGDPAGGLDADGLAACAAGADGLAQLSAERVGAEMKKLLSAPDPAPAVAAMAQAGILARVMPGADTKALPVLVHLEDGAGFTRRVACLGGEDLKDRWRLSKAEAAEIALLRDLIGADTGLAEIAYRHGADAARDVALLRAALFEQPLPDGMQDEVATGAGAVFPVKAADLMPEFSGPALGAKLQELETRWIASGFALTRAELLG